MLRAKNFRIQNSTAEVKIWNLINYLTICCQGPRQIDPHMGIMVKAQKPIWIASKYSKYF
jgi:hypothetical protein